MLHGSCAYDARRLYKVQPASATQVAAAYLSTSYVRESKAQSARAINVCVRSIAPHRTRTRLIVENIPTLQSDIRTRTDRATMQHCQMPPTAAQETIGLQASNCVHFYRRARDAHSVLDARLLLCMLVATPFGVSLTIVQCAYHRPTLLPPHLQMAHHNKPPEPCWTALM